MKSVLISIRPKWCELIASGKKTVEVRKSKPKLETPFKCYIYCTHSKNGIAYCKGNDILNGKVIGEFVCDKILDIFVSCSDPNMKGLPFPCTGLTDKEIMDYLGNGKMGFGWHISDLVIYDTPKKLSEFHKCGAMTIEELDEGLCSHCSATNYGDSRMYHTPNGVYMCEGRWCEDAYQKYLDDEFTLTRPPQSWCYVEGGDG